MKRCLFCRKPLTRKTRPSGLLESDSELAKRVFCSNNCSNAHRGKLARQNRTRPKSESKSYLRPENTDEPMEAVYYAILKQEGEL